MFFSLPKNCFRWLCLFESFPPSPPAPPPFPPPSKLRERSCPIALTPAPALLPSELRTAPAISPLPPPSSLTAPAAPAACVTAPAALNAAFPAPPAIAPPALPAIEAAAIAPPTAPLTAPIAPCALKDGVPLKRPCAIPGADLQIKKKSKQVNTIIIISSTAPVNGRVLCCFASKRKP